MTVIAAPLLLLTLLVALRVALWSADTLRTRRSVAAVRAATVRSGVPVTVPLRAPVRSEVGGRRDLAA
jgi:hypothetical protein